MSKQKAGSTRSKPSQPRKKAKSQRPSLRQVIGANGETFALILLVVCGLLALDLTLREEGTVAFMRQAFGWAAWIVLIGLTLAAVAVLTRQGLARFNKGEDFPWPDLAEASLGLTLVLLAILGLSHLWNDAADPLQLALDGEGGGLVGWLVGALPGLLLGGLIAGLLLFVLAGLGVWLAARPLGLPTLDGRQLLAILKEYGGRLLPQAVDDPTPPPTKAPPREEPVQSPLPSIAAPAPPKPKRKRAPRTKPTPAPIKAKPRPEHLPPLDILSGPSTPKSAEADIEYKKQVIEHTLASFNVPVEVVDVNVGPAVTQFGVKPGYLVRRGPDGRPVQRRVRVSRIKSLSNDLALALEAPTLRIEAPVPGKGYVGIEVPNSATNMVALRPVLESANFHRINSPLAFALGRDVSGEPVAADLATMPHLLIAGATGSGKSVCINAIVASLLFSNGPDQLRLVLVDPKQVELTIYNGIPHLVSPVVTDLDQVTGALTWLLLQMDDRYRAFTRVGARHILDYNRKVGRKRKPKEWADLEPVPYLVLVIDELADLMMAHPDAVEHNLCRLAQMARATGIHLVVSTQRPSVDVITGLIKANFPARIAFSVTSQTDSRVILDTPGADKLLGQGDMLFMRPDSSKLSRVQGSFVSDKEIERLVRFWTESMPAEELAPNQPRFPWTGLMAQLEDQDELYEQALDLIQDQERVSASWLQRRLRVGYNKASELMARMEADGYVGPDEGGGRGREVLLETDDDEDEMVW